MICTELTSALQIDAPIVAAPLGRGTTPKFLAAVADAGAFGFTALRHIPAAEIEGEVRRHLKCSSGRAGFNLTLLGDQHQRLDAALAAGARIISLWSGEAAPYILKAKAAGTTVFWTVGSVDEAREARSLGVDFLVAQGREAGGHLVGSAATMSLLPSIVDAANGVPVIAAGGIADGRGLAAALCLGACGVWMGTRFVASKESENHPGHKELIVASDAVDVVETELFDGGWPDTPHRVLRNSTYRAWEAAGRPPPRARPLEGETIGTYPTGQPVHRYDVTAPWRTMVGNWEACALYAGSSTQLVQSVKSVSQIVSDMVVEAEEILQELNRLFPCKRSRLDCR